MISIAASRSGPSQVVILLASSRFISNVTAESGALSSSEAPYSKSPRDDAERRGPEGRERPADPDGLDVRGFAPDRSRPLPLFFIDLICDWR